MESQGTEEYVPNENKINLRRNLNEMEVSNLGLAEFKVMVIKMLTELGGRIDDENFNKETRKI